VGQLARGGGRTANAKEIILPLGLTRIGSEGIGMWAGRREGGRNAMRRRTRWIASSPGKKPSVITKATARAGDRTRSAGSDTRPRPSETPANEATTESRAADEGFALPSMAKDDTSEPNLSLGFSPEIKGSKAGYGSRPRDRSARVR